MESSRGSHRRGAAIGRANIESFGFVRSTCEDAWCPSRYRRDAARGGAGSASRCFRGRARAARGIPIRRLVGSDRAAGQFKSAPATNGRKPLCVRCLHMSHVPVSARARVTCAIIPIGKHKADRRIDVSVCQHPSAKSSIHNVKLPPPAQTRFVGRPVLHPLNDIFGMW